jgi:hypothetical protein
VPEKAKKGHISLDSLFLLGPNPPELAKEGRIKITNWNRKTIMRDGDPGAKEGEKSICLDLQLVVQLMNRYRRLR